jgi:hypothetical protein
MNAPIQRHVSFESKGSATDEKRERSSSLEKKEAGSSSSSTAFKSQ